MFIFLIHIPLTVFKNDNQTPSSRHSNVKDTVRHSPWGKKFRFLCVVFAYFHSFLTIFQRTHLIGLTPLNSTVLTPQELRHSLCVGGITSGYSAFFSFTFGAIDNTISDLLTVMKIISDDNTYQTPSAALPVKLPHRTQQFTNFPFRTASG